MQDANQLPNVHPYQGDTFIAYLRQAPITKWKFEPSLGYAPRRSDVIATRWEIVSWNGELLADTVRLIRKHKSNMGDTRMHFRFLYGNDVWYGLNAGDNDIIRCKRTKYTRLLERISIYANTY